MQEYFSFLKKIFLKKTLENTDLSIDNQWQKTRGGVKHVNKYGFSFSIHNMKISSKRISLLLGTFPSPLGNIGKYEKNLNEKKEFFLCNNYLYPWFFYLGCHSSRYIGHQIGVQRWWKSVNSILAHVLILYHFCNLGNCKMYRACLESWLFVFCVPFPFLTWLDSRTDVCYFWSLNKIKLEKNVWFLLNVKDYNSIFFFFIYCNFTLLYNYNFFKGVITN